MRAQGREMEISEEKKRSFIKAETQLMVAPNGELRRFLAQLSQKRGSEC